ncbi:hypothetical protein IYY11_00275, partial [Methylocystis sp. H62]
TDGAMYGKWWTGSGWGGWENMGGVLLNKPECVTWGPGHLHCFGRGTDGAMYGKWWTGSGWGGWENMGGVLLNKPECVTWGPGHLHCFGRGTDGAMYGKWWTGSGWGGWENMGGVLLNKPECVSWGPGHLHCFGRGTDGAMYGKWWTGNGWGGWENMGGVILEEPECVSWGPGHLHCFARGTDRAMYGKWWTGSGWSGWENMGGVLLNKPECVSWGPGHLHCFGRGTDGAMYGKWWTGNGWGGWENMGGVILEEPECVSWGPGHLHCFARGTDRAMYGKWWTDVARRSLTVSRHNTAGLTDGDVDRILGDSSTVLQTNDGPDDVACSVALQRSGNVVVFNNGDGSLDNAAELSEVFNLAGNVKVVADVNFCGGQFNTSIIGCGQTPGTSFITERFTAGQEGILWAHEFGHNQNLPHRDTSTDNVMYFSIGNNRRRINQTECNAFSGQQPVVNVAAMNIPSTTVAQGVTSGPGMPGEQMRKQSGGQMPGEQMPNYDAGGQMPGEQMRKQSGGQMPGEQMPNYDAGGQMPGEQMRKQSGGQMPGEQMPNYDAGGQMPREQMQKQSSGQMPNYGSGEQAPGEQIRKYSGGQATAREKKLPVDQFVSQVYFDGLPLAEAASYGDESVDTLLTILRDPSRVQYHENAALTLGMIGSERAVEPLIAYIQGRREATAQLPGTADAASSHAAYKGRVGAVMALGYIVSRNGSKAALTFLKDNASPQALKLLWMGDGRPEEAKQQDLTKYFLLSLGISGNTEAAEHLKALRQREVVPEAAPRKTKVEGVLAQSLQLNDQVAREGLLNYYKSKQETPR